MTKQMRKRCAMQNTEAKFSGKTLLILGTSAGSNDIVKYAKSNGAHTIVIDYLQPELSESKLVADDNFLISTADTDTIINLIKTQKIDGVISGISEFNILQSIKLCETCRLPFYCTEEQWWQIGNKANFRTLCEKHNVPCPKTWFKGDKIPYSLLETIEYPVVVKPVDGSASKGVYICFNKEDLIQKAFSSSRMSSCGQIIIEEYVNGYEFTAHYTIYKGEPSLSSIDNRYGVQIHEGTVTTIPAARIYPSLFTHTYINKVNNSILRLCKGLGLDIGVLFVQGIYNPETESFYIFEAGLRSAAELPCRFIEIANGINYMNMLVDYSLLGSAEFDIQRDDPFLGGKCCGIVSFVAKGGKVGSIVGLEDALHKIPSIKIYENRYPVGRNTPDTNYLQQLMLRFVMICESREEMYHDIDLLNKLVDVYDDHGNDLVIKFQPSRLADLK